MEKIKFTEFTMSHYLKLSTNAVEEFVLFGHFKEGHNFGSRTIGTFDDLETANFIKRLLTTTLIKKGK